MKKKSVLEVLFPQVRAEILRLLFSSPADRRYVRELRSKSRLALSTVQQELRRLRAVGLVVSTTNGYRRFYQPNREHPLFGTLMQIVYLSEGLPDVKDSALGPIRRSRGYRKSKRRLARLSPERPHKWGILSAPARELDRFKRSSSR